MQASALATKIQIPPQTHHMVRRARLVDALEQGIPDHKLVLISAPAGYGKTTLLAQWAHTSSLQVTWLSLGEEDNDSDRFFRYLLAAWETVHPGIRESPLGLLLGALEPDRDAVLSAFINVANDLPDHTVFIFDDVHLIEDASIYESLTFLLDHLPPTLHLVLAGRSEPPLPLARYRARHELLELRTDDLSFLAEETAAFLNRLMGLDLGDEAVNSLHTQLEGWVAGLQLVSLSLLRQRAAATPLVISGRHRFIADYLSEDVVVHLPEEIRRFLLQTSILDRLCGSLCDAVTGSSGGQEMLELLERENLFLVPLDDNREWFRYHRLFADFLRDGCQRHYPDQIRGLHRRAGRWHLAHDLPEEAFHHALAGDDLDLVVQILDQFESAKLHGGELRTLQAWLDSIPARWYAAYPLLGLTRAGVLAFTGALDACVRCIDDVEQRLAPAASEEARWQQARVTAFRCFVACFQSDLEQAEMHAAQALRDLRAEDHSLRADIYHALGDTYRGHGRWEQARAQYLKVLDLADAPAGGLRAAHVFGALADLDLLQGRLRDAEAHWKKALAAVEEPANWGRLPLPVIGWVYLRLGEILYERNELGDAWKFLSQGLERAELGGDVRALIAGYLLLGRLTLTESDVAEAAAYLERARPLVEEAPFLDWTSRFERLRVDLWLAQDKLRTAVGWADAAMRNVAVERRPESEVAQLTVARVLIAKGDAPSIERAMALLADLRQAAEGEGRAGIQIEALALQALAHWNSGDRARAMIVLERALRLAEPEGYVRLFADLGLPMFRLLQGAQAREVMPEYTRQLLDAFISGVAPHESLSAALREPLSEREQEVLGLMAAGLTNREIAETLFISPETVKKHTGSIYAKFGVGHRTQAVARARELSILNDSR
ncbi:MAG: ATP-dependent transcriptional regulator [Thermomicrobiales bacterium]|nr:ATP-dependent transcriptional regulator [Thermomicrobiales bacterium]